MDLTDEELIATKKLNGTYYEKAETAIKNLEDYIKIDEKRLKVNNEMNYFEIFCQNHCRDIAALIYYYKKLQKDKINLESKIFEYTVVYLDGFYDGKKQVENKLKMKEREIDYMATEINLLYDSCPLESYNYDIDCKHRCYESIKEADCWKKYFENKVKKDLDKENKNESNNKPNK